MEHLPHLTLLHILQQQMFPLQYHRLQRQYEHHHQLGWSGKIRLATKPDLELLVIQWLQPLQRTLRPLQIQDYLQTLDTNTTL